MSSSEFDIIRRYFSRQGMGREDVSCGIGDDAALLLPPPGHELVVTVDTLIAGVHFPENTSAEAIGHKALAVNLSDLAAMGAAPAWLTLALTLPAANDGWLKDFAHGFFSLAQQFEAQLVGGDTTRGPLSITVQAMGFVPLGKALTRGCAQAGDGIFVTGSLGDAAAGLQILQARLRAAGALEAALVERLERPTPRVAEGYLLRGLASAAIDVSDGLAADLGHILEASGVGAEILLDQLPLSPAFQSLDLENNWQLAVSGGDDYELCFTVPPAHEAEVMERFTTVAVPCTRIGEIKLQSGMCWQDAAGKMAALPLAGYDHFAREAHID